MQNAEQNTLAESSAPISLFVFIAFLLSKLLIRFGFLYFHLEFSPALRAAHAVVSLLVLNAELRLAERALDVFELLALPEFLKLKLKKVLYGIEYLSEHPIFTRAHIDVARKSAEHRQAQKRELDAEQKRRLQGLDVLMIPVGGFFTIDADEAAAIAKELAPKCIIPMHYRGENFGYDVLGKVDLFTRHFPNAKAISDTLELGADLPEVVVMDFNH